MKPLLRKIFFWDAPAKGAFFGLTLLMTLLTIGLGTGCVSTIDAGKNPGVGLFTLVSTPIMMPFAGCIKGVDDAWRGLSFWQLTPMWKEKEEF